MGNSVGLRIGVLVNDFSTVNLDAAELSAAAEAAPGGIPLVELSNGCVCCAAGEDLQAAVGVTASVDLAPQHEEAADGFEVDVRELLVHHLRRQLAHRAHPRIEERLGGVR